MTTLILNKGQQTRIANEAGTPIMNITVGCNWGKISRIPSTGLGLMDKLFGKAAQVAGQLEAVDLDLSILMYDKSGHKVEECAFYRNKSCNGAVLHSGDDREGDDSDDGLDNERIQFKGLEVAKHPVQTAFIILNSYTHQKFDAIPYIRLGIYDGLFSLSQKAARLQEFNLHNDKSFVGAEAVILARLDKTTKGWELTVLAEPSKDTSISAIDHRIRCNLL